MGYYFYDVNGYVADGPSTTGLEKLRDALTGPAIEELFEEGSTMQLEDLLTELSASISDDPSVKVSIMHLRRTATLATEILILTDGVGHEES